MRNPLAADPPWRQLRIISVALPVMISLAALAFGWPVARIAPRDLPVGVAGNGPCQRAGCRRTSHAEPGGFSSGTMQRRHQLSRRSRFAQSMARSLSAAGE